MDNSKEKQIYEEVEKLSKIIEEETPEAKLHEVFIPRVISFRSELTMKDVDELFEISAREGWGIEPHNRYGHNSLIELAAGMGHVELVNHLLTNVGGYELNQKDTNGEYALICALSKATSVDDMGRRTLECAALLVENGASLDIISRDGKTAKEILEERKIEEELNRTVIDLRLRNLL